MKKKSFWCCLWLLVAFLLITSCEFQRQPIAPGVSSTETIANTATVQPTLGLTPVTTASPAPTVIWRYVIQPMSDLPPGQYVVYAESHDCDNDITDTCSDLTAISMDGNEYHSIVEGLPSEDFIYQGGYVAYTVFHPFEEEHNQLQVLNLETDQLIEIPVQGMLNCQAEDWSPDGTFLVVLCSQGKGLYYYEIGLLSVPDGEYTLLMADSYADGSSGGYEQARLSPDGRWLAFFRIYSTGPELVEGLYVLDMACTSDASTCQDLIRRLPLERVVGEFGKDVIDWTPDGYLAVAIDSQIEVYDVSTWQRIRTISVSEADGYITKMAWSPDGEWILVLKSYAAITIEVDKTL